MKIKKMVCSPGLTGFFFDDQLAIKRGAVADGANYIGQPMTPGFTTVRQPGESIAVMLQLEDNQIAWADCCAVQYSGAGGRDPLFLAADYIPIIYEHVAPHYEGREITTFREMVEELDEIRVNGKKLHTAIRYGVSQVLLHAVGLKNNKLMCDVIAEEYGLTVTNKMIPIFAQSGDDRYNNADKMIIKGVPVLPHALINNVETKLGKKASCWWIICNGWSSASGSSDRKHLISRLSKLMSTVRSVKPSEHTISVAWRTIWKCWKKPSSHSSCGSRVRWMPATATLRSNVWPSLPPK